jgi:uncharacterized protein (DUF2236 family)
MIRAAIEILPAWARDLLGLDTVWRLRPWEAALVRCLGAVSEKVVVKSAPPAQACMRMGLPADYLYRPARA